jgi:hypothetical protein
LADLAAERQLSPGARSSFRERFKSKAGETHFGRLPDRVGPKHWGRHIRDQRPTIDHMSGRYRKGFLDFVPSSYRESRLRLEVIDCASKQFVDKAAHIVWWENESTFFVDQIAPPQRVVPNVGQRVSQKS